MSEISKININDKPLVDSISEKATAFVSDNGKFLRVPLDVLTRGGGRLRGEYDSLPEDAVKGDIIVLSKPVYKPDTVFIPGDVFEIIDVFYYDEETDVVRIPLYTSYGTKLLYADAFEASFRAYGKGGTFSCLSYYSEYKVSSEPEWVGIEKDDRYLYAYFKHIEGQTATTLVEMCGNDTEITIPDAYITGDLSDYRMVIYDAGDCLMYDGTSWHNLSGDSGAELTLINQRDKLKFEELNNKINEARNVIGVYDVENGNAAGVESYVGCKAYYIYGIDSKNKKIYLSDTQNFVYDSTRDYTDTDFPTPAYDVGDIFSIKGDNYAFNVGRITAIEYNVISYELIGSFPEEWKYKDLEEWDNTLYVPAKPDVGNVNVIFSSAALGEGNKVVASRSFAAGAYNSLQGYMDIVLGGFNNVYGSSNVALGHGLYLVKDHQHARGWYNVSDPKGLYADVFGIGTETENEDGTKTIKRSNAYSLDWDGNMRFKGKVYECCEDGTGNGHELARASLLGFNSPYVSRYSEDGDLYAEARDSLSYEFKTDADGLVYTHMVPQNTQSFMGLICYSLPLVPLSQGKIWVKFLMRTNQTVSPNVVVYNVKDKDDKALSSPQKAGSITGDGQWHEVLIEFDNLPEGAYTTNYIQIQFAGRLIRGSAYYNADGTLKNDAYFDVASWGIFTDKVSAESFDLASREHTGSLVGYVNEKTQEVKDLINESEVSLAGEGGMTPTVFVTVSDTGSVISKVANLCYSIDDGVTWTELADTYMRDHINLWGNNGIVSYANNYDGTVFTIKTSKLKLKFNATGKFDWGYPYLRGIVDGVAMETITLTDNNVHELSFEIADHAAFFCAPVSTCLTGDTLILMADGSERRIDSLLVGEKVLSYDPETMQLVPDVIIYTDSKEDKKHTEYDLWEFSDGTSFKTVHRHRFYNVDRKAMVYMDEWEMGEHCVKADGTQPWLIAHHTYTEEINHYTLFTERQNYFANGTLSGNRYTKALCIPRIEEVAE